MDSGPAIVEAADKVVVREARLVPVVDFKGRTSPDAGLVDAEAAPVAAPGDDGG